MNNTDFKPIKADLKVKTISDNSKYDSKNLETIQSRKVSLEDDTGTLKITLSGRLDTHPLAYLNKKSDVNLDASLVLNIGNPNQKRIDDRY